MFQVLLSCRDCTGEDPLGCFDGGTEWLNEGQTFATREEADAAGYAETKGCGPWEWEVFEVEP